MTCSSLGLSSEDTPNTAATTFRSVMLHLKYLVFSVLGALVWASLMAAEGTGVRKDNCQLFGATVDKGCPALAANNTQNETIYGLGVAVVIINAGLFLMSLFTHLHESVDAGSCARTQYARLFRFLTCATNVALFVALIVSFRDDDDKNDGAKLLATANLENSVYFKDTFNPYIAAAFGLGFSLIDAVVGSIIIYRVYGKRCNSQDHGSYGEGSGYQ